MRRGACQCEPGKCGAATVVDLGGATLGSYDVDDQFIYYSKDYTSIQRAPVAGGASSLVTSDTANIEDVRIAGPNVVYTWFDNQTFNQYKLKKVPAQGGQATTLDSGAPTTTNAVESRLAVRSTGAGWAAYWWAKTRMNEFDVATGALITSFLPGNYNPEGPMVTNASSLYFATFVVDYYTFFRDGTGLDGYSAPSFNSFDLAVDAPGNLYFTDTGSGSILQIKLNGHTTVYSGQGTLNGLAVDDTDLYWIKANGTDYEILRGPKAGGARPRSTRGRSFTSTRLVTSSCTVGSSTGSSTTRFGGSPNERGTYRSWWGRPRGGHAPRVLEQGQRFGQRRRGQHRQRWKRR